jgi:hypothetical protein
MPTVEGKAYWASITRPNTTFEPVYQIDLSISDDAADSFKKEGIAVKQDDRGNIVKFKRKVNRADGNKNPSPRLVDSARNPIDTLIGNGSTVKVMYKPFEWKFAGKSGKSLDLQAVQVIDLVPYGEDFDVASGYVADTNGGEEF